MSSREFVVDVAIVAGLCAAQPMMPNPISVATNGISAMKKTEYVS
jgi:hypothetical protein